MNRYQRQILLPQLGEARQQLLMRSSVLLVGCGALGTVIAEQLARAGVGFLRICDRDIVELTNLQRQTLFDECDQGEPKAYAAVRRLAQINSTIRIEPQVVDVNGDNIERFCSDVHLILDGTDNVETRYIINDAAVRFGKPWIYGGCVGTSGQVMPILPGRTPCLRCLFPTPPGAGELPTCDTAGVLAAAANIVASLQVTEAIRILVGDAAAASEMTRVQLWPTRITTISTKDARRPDCPTCGQRNFEFLDRRPGFIATTLCGRNTVQIRPPHRNVELDLAAIASRLERIGVVHKHDQHLRCELPNVTMTLFYDGRALIHGTSDPALARSIYAKYVGS
jgi:adenylyltransferase/sulfurtransferase